MPPSAPASGVLNKGPALLRTRRFREKRMRDFAEVFHPSPGTRILDIGGTALNWQLLGIPSQVTLLNITAPDDVSDLPPNLRYVEGDGRRLDYPDSSFDICFSNSTIEHLFTLEGQVRFAAEVRRVCQGVFVQTPARCFPFEPHWYGLFIHWLPKRARRKVARHLAMYGLLYKPSQQTIDHLVDEYRLLSYREMRVLFPDCEIRRERFLGITKSYVAIRRAKGAAS